MLSHHAYVIPSFLHVAVRLYLVIVNSNCSHNYCLLHIAKTGHLRCCLYNIKMLKSLWCPKLCSFDTQFLLCDSGKTSCDLQSNISVFTGLAEDFCVPAYTDLQHVFMRMSMTNRLRNSRYMPRTRGCMSCLSASLKASPCGTLSKHLLQSIDMPTKSDPSTNADSTASARSIRPQHVSRTCRTVSANLSCHCIVSRILIKASTCTQTS